jgi:serine/threonine protein kinase
MMSSIIIIGIVMAMRMLKALKATFATSAKSGKGREWGLVDDYEVLHPLGKGSSARVFQGVQVLTGKPVVIKMFKNISPEAIKKEIEINYKLLNGLKPDQHQKVRFV